MFEQNVTVQPVTLITNHGAAGLEALVWRKFDKSSGAVEVEAWVIIIVRRLG
jgi:hypothetical protein